MEDCTISYMRNNSHHDAASGNCRDIVQDFNLEVKQGERIFLQGKNGCGKSSIIKAILQAAKDEGDNRNQLDLPENLVLSKGRIELPNQLVVSYCSQDTSKLSGTLREYAAENEIDETLFLALLRKLDFSRTQFEKRIEDFSGGQKKKVLIAGSLCQRAHLYIWDEPLNFIDVFSRMQIEELILKFKPTMILVEHDKMFVEQVATRVITL